MKLLEVILNKILLEASVSKEDIDDALDNHKRVIINYHTKGEDNNTGARVAEIYAYGSKNGNDVIRVFQPYGDTTTRVPGWKLMRLDRISGWETTKQTFNTPASERYKGLGDFNPSGDKTMDIVYKVAKFGDEDIQSTQDSQPKTKQDIYKTDTENNMEQLRQQLNNPIKLSDIKDGDKFKQYSFKEPENAGPKTKQDIEKSPNQPELFKTDTELGMERLRQQLQNPKKIDLSQFDRKPKQKTPEEQKKDLEKLRQTLKDKESMSLSDLNKAMNEPETTEATPEETENTENQTNQPELFKTDTEKNMERLRQQLNNPRKIDLSRIPRR